MSRDLYVSLSGASATWTHLEAISNNLANMSTTGYKAGRVAFKVAGPTDTPLGEAYAMSTEDRLDRQDGALKRTENPFDLAVQGEGFFTVQDQNGQTFLTRDGRFHMNENRELVNNQGMTLMSDGGAVQVQIEDDLRVTDDGRLVGSTSGEFGRLQISNAADLERAGGNMFRPTSPIEIIENPIVQQGALEESNTDPLATMVELVQATRYFEVYQKAMQASDEADSKLLRTGG
jgi:flagellar basal body rod protein FlgG